MEDLAKILPAKLNHHISFQRIVARPRQEKKTKNKRAKESHSYRTESKGGVTLEKVPFDHRELTREKNTKYVSLSIFTANLTADPSDIAHIYLMGVLQNVILHELVYTDWGMVIYVDVSSWHVYPDLYKKYFTPILEHYPNVHVIAVDWRTKLPRKTEEEIVKVFGSQVERHRNRNGWDLALVASEAKLPGNLPIQFAKTVYRFFPGGYNVAFVSRDADARINIREEIASHEWIHSTYTFSRMFDNPAHSNPLLAGMWGAKSHCHNVLRNFAVYGSCRFGDVPLPGIVNHISRFLSDKTTMLRGYGIDELFLGEVDDRISKNYYDNVITYGKGGYYAGSIVFSFFTDRQSLKIGNRLMCLMPCKTPDTFEGAHQSEQNFELEDGIPVLGRQCYFVGEDLPCKASVPPEVIDWLIFWSLNFRHANQKDMKPKQLRKQFETFGIRLDPTTFSEDVFHLPVAEFQIKYNFDKRIMPHFWYCFLTGTNENIPFTEVYGTFNTNEYEIRVFQEANRQAFFKHKKLQEPLLQVVNTKIFNQVSNRINEVLFTGQGSVKVGRHNISPFFKTLRKFVEEHSRVYHKLNSEEIYSYWSEMLNVYPFSAMRSFGLEF